MAIQWYSNLNSGESSRWKTYIILINLHTSSSKPKRWKTWKLCRVKHIVPPRENAERSEIRSTKLGNSTPTWLRKEKIVLSIPAKHLWQQLLSADFQPAYSIYKEDQGSLRVFILSATALPTKEIYQDFYWFEFSMLQATPLPASLRKSYTQPPALDRWWLAVKATIWCLYSPAVARCRKSANRLCSLLGLSTICARGDTSVLRSSCGVFHWNEFLVFWSWRLAKFEPSTLV